MNTSNGPSHFALFEFTRILVPGFYFIFVALVFVSAFRLPAFPLDGSDFRHGVFLIGGLLAGLTLYAKESPKRRKAFTANQPSRYILDRSRRIRESSALTEDEARRLYFYILNNRMPASFHEKIFFFGMIYQTIVSIRRTSFWYGVLGLLLLGTTYASSGRVTPEELIPVGLVWLTYALNVRYNKADRKMQENYQDQIFWLTMNADLVDRLLVSCETRPAAQ